VRDLSSPADFSTAHPSLQRALAGRGYATPTAVQAAILAPEVAARDLLVSAQTGSGKTVAFGLALAPTLLADAARFPAAGAPRALIVTPTRELALQVHRELTWLFAETGARITTCVGGMDPRRESHALGHGVHIVVGTPGRLCDHLARGSLALDRLAAVVLDEADEMLDMGFREDLERLLDAAPRERRTLMFSATIPPPIAQMAKRYQQTALRIAAAGEGDRHRDIAYQVVSIVPRERDLAVVNLLRFHDPPGALVFCATRDGVTHLAANLSERGFSVAALSGELSQRERNQALQALRDGRARVCVATDVAARGLDLPNLDLVIHADLPQNKETMVHRSGRTGRAGKKGLAILIAVDAGRRYVERLLSSARVEASWGLPPSSDDIRERDQAHLAGEVSALTEELTDADRAVARDLLASASAEDLVAALVRVRREARPAPEELTVPASMRPRGERGDRNDRNDRGDHRGPADRPRSRYDHAVRVPRGHDDAPPRGVRPAHHADHRHADHAARPDFARPERAEHAARPERAEHAARPERPEHAARPERAEHAARPERPEPAARPERPEHAARPEREPRGHLDVDRVWFTINIGRSKNADPKWLIPLLCRRGGISKNAIGKIQILARETRVEISHDVSERFAAAVREPDSKDRNIHIEPLDFAS
jgi:ATP-dependent RNA helicase DeaD